MSLLRVRSALRWFGTLILVAGVLSLVPGAPAGAHAVIVSSTPTDGDRIPVSPSEVTIEFSEAVSIDLGGLTVLDAAGARVDSGTTDQPKPTTIHTSLPPDLPTGTYLANYKVVSADGHPINGAIVFGVGNATIKDVSGLTQKTDSTLDAVSKALQFLTYLGALGAAGLAFFLAFVHDGGHDRRQLSRWARWSTALAAVGIVGTIFVQGALATSGSLSAVLDRQILGPVLRQGLGWQSALLFTGLAMVYLSVESRRTVWAQSLAFYGGVVVCAAFVFWGHATASERPWLSIPADVVHVCAAAVWFGGLIGLTTVLRGRSRSDGFVTSTPGDPAITGTARVPGSLSATAQIVGRFSTTAAASVAVLLVAGVALAYVELGSIGALTSTTYGLVLLTKIALVAVVLFLAAYNRFFLLPWLLGGDVHAVESTGSDGSLGGPAEPLADSELSELSESAGIDASAAVTDPVADGDTVEHDATSATAVDEDIEERRAGWRVLVRTVQLEALILVAVLVVTGILVNTSPGGTAPVSELFQQSKPFRDGKVALTITPNQPGTNSFHLDIEGPDGRPADLAQKVTIELSLPAKDLGPIERGPMIKAGTGHFLLEGLNDMSIAGEWTVVLVMRVSDFDQERITFQDTLT